MFYIKQGESIPPNFGRDGAIAIVLGHMDGLHRGHVRLLSRARSLVGVDGEVVVMSFAPHAKSFFTPDQQPFMLQTTDEKLATLQTMGIDMYYEVCFDQKLSECLPQDFIDRYIVDYFAADFVVVGENFRFGKGREGTVTLLGEDNRFETCCVGMQYDRQAIMISSSKVREALTAGDVDLAKILLGRPYAVMGRVEAGEGIASEQGVATANLAWHKDKLRMRHGVYVVYVQLSCGGRYYGIANFGLRPTFGIHLEPRLEVHLFDFEQSLYGETIEVGLLKFIRDEHKFSAKEALFAQIGEDVKLAKNWLAAKGYTAAI